MIGFSKALAQEVASRGITVNTVAPGFIETAMTGALNEEQKAKLLDRIPGGDSERRRTWLRPWLTSPVRRPPMSPARPCTSMAGWP